MEDQSKLTQNIMFESVLKVCRMFHLPKSQFGPVAFADLPRCTIFLRKRGNLKIAVNLSFHFRLSPLFNHCHDLLMQNDFSETIVSNENLAWLTHPALVYEAIVTLQSRLFTLGHRTGSEEGVVYLSTCPFINWLK